MTLALQDDTTATTARIVVVDDDPGIRDVVTEFLSRHGFEVETAADAAENSDGRWPTVPPI